MRQEIANITERVDELQYKSEIQTFDITEAEEHVDPMLKYLWFCREAEPTRASEILQCKALEFVTQWEEEHGEDGSKALQEYWLELWKTREEFEEELKQEMKGF